MVLPVPQFRQPRQHRGKVTWIARFEFVEKLLNRALSSHSFIQLYRERDAHATSILVLCFKRRSLLRHSSALEPTFRHHTCSQSPTPSSHGLQDGGSRTTRRCSAAHGPAWAYSFLPNDGSSATPLRLPRLSGLHFESDSAARGRRRGHQLPDGLKERLDVSIVAGDLAL